MWRDSCGRDHSSRWEILASDWSPWRWLKTVKHLISLIRFVMTVQLYKCRSVDTRDSTVMNEGGLTRLSSGMVGVVSAGVGEGEDLWVFSSTWTSGWLTGSGFSSTAAGSGSTSASGSGWGSGVTDTSSCGPSGSTLKNKQTSMKPQYSGKKESSLSRGYTAITKGYWSVTYLTNPNWSVCSRAVRLINWFFQWI